MLAADAAQQKTPGRRNMSNDRAIRATELQLDAAQLSKGSFR
jgi:hypothetical protein